MRARFNVEVKNSNRIKSVAFSVVNYLMVGIACLNVATASDLDKVISMQNELKGGGTQPAPQMILKLERSAIAKTGAQSVDWSPDGKFIATIGGALPALVWNAKTLTVEHELGQGQRGGTAAAHGAIKFSKDGSLLAFGTYAVVSVWDAHTWQGVSTLIAPGVDPSIPQSINVTSVAFSQDQSLIVAAYYERKINPVIAYRVKDGGLEWSYEQQHTIGSPLVGTSLVPLNANGQIAFGTGEAKPSAASRERFTRVVFLNAQTGTFVRSIDNIHADYPTAMAISPDGKWLATATSTGIIEGWPNKPPVFENKDPIRVWDVETGKIVRELPVTSSVWSLAFTNDNKYLISSQVNHPGRETVSVWSLEKQTLVQAIVLPYRFEIAYDLVFSPDGKHLAVAGGSGLATFSYQPEH